MDYLITLKEALFTFTEKGGFKLNRSCQMMTWEGVKVNEENLFVCCFSIGATLNHVFRTLWFHDGWLGSHWKLWMSVGFGYGYGGMFMGILFLILIGVAIYFIIQNVRSKNEIGQAKELPLDILKKRYAKGEITKEDFDRMKNELQ